MPGRSRRRRFKVPRSSVPEIGLTIRLGLALATLGLGVLTRTTFELAPWVLAVACMDVLIVILLRWRRDLPTVWPMLALGGLTALATVAMQVVESYSTFFLVAIAALHAGARLGWIGTLVTGWSTLMTGFLMIEFTSHNDFRGVGLVLWMIAVVLVTLVAALWYVPPPSKDAIAADEARELLIRLGSLADSIDTGFDLPALGDATLERIAGAVSLERAAVILRNMDGAVPVSLRGLRRMPWLAPADRSSALNHTWEKGVTARGTHVEGEHRFHTLVVPLKDAPGAVIGLIALDRRSHPFTTEDQETIVDLTEDASRLFEVGLLFSRLRGRAALEERTRLARDMHDGVAQELAALAFSVDMLVQQSDIDSPIRSGLVTLRASMRQSLSDIRHQISTLQMVERPAVSLGAILSSTLQAFGTQTGIRTTIAIEESRFRFPAHVEVQLHRLAQDFINDARSSEATWIDWEISLSAPNARLVLMHDGASTTPDEFYANHPVAQHGEIVVDELIPRGHYVEVTLGTDPQAEVPLPIDDFIGELELAPEISGPTEQLPALSAAQTRSDRGDR